MGKPRWRNLSRQSLYVHAWIIHPGVDQSQDVRFKHGQKPCKNLEILYTVKGMLTWESNPTYRYENGVFKHRTLHNLRHRPHNMNATGFPLKIWTGFPEQKPLNTSMYFELCRYKNPYYGQYVMICLNPETPDMYYMYVHCPASLFSLLLQLNCSVFAIKKFFLS